MLIGNLEVYGIIYKITNRVNGKVYIGQTVQDFERRYCIKGEGVERVYLRHKMLKEYGYGYNKHLLESFEKYGVDNFELNKYFDFAFSRDELNIKEVMWINYYNSYRNGYNNNLGGKGNSGFDGLKGINNPSGRKIVQISLNGEFIREWDYIVEVENSLGILRSDICGVCSGDKKSAGGFMWRYVEDYNKDIQPYKKETNAIPVIQLSLDGKYIDRFNSIIEAGKRTRLDYKSISGACSSNRKSYGGHIWVKECEYDKNKNYSYEMPKKGVSKSITMYDINMNKIKTYKSINEAYKETGYYRYQISKNINKEPNNIKDYIFEYTYNYILVN